MAQKSKVREITIVEESGTFTSFFKKFTGESAASTAFDFDGVTSLRKLLSNERARLLHVLKTKKPTSIYALAKVLGRDFKSVFEDIKLLERFGFVELVAEKTGKRERLKPTLITSEVIIKLKI